MNKTNTIPLKDNWKSIWNSTTGRFQLLTGTSLLLLLLTTLPYFFSSIEKRQGVQLYDWVLENLPAQNMSVYIFSIIWGMALLAFYRAFSKPYMFVTYVWAYSFIILTRIVTIGLFKLDPPAGLIQLTDPLTGFFYGHTNVTKDLFFSGHTATLCLFYLTLEKKTDKIIGLLAVVTVGILLLVQHVHYTLDVVVAPIAVYPIYKLVTYMFSEKNAQGRSIN